LERQYTPTRETSTRDLSIDVWTWPSEQEDTGLGGGIKEGLEIKDT